jgi:hypothetical protein
MADGAGLTERRCGLTEWVISRKANGARRGILGVVKIW